MSPLPRTRAAEHQSPPIGRRLAAAANTDGGDHGDAYLAPLRSTFAPSTSSLRIGEAANRAGVRPSLIRYYEKEGLLPAPARESGQRRYDESLLRRLAIIDVAQRAGLSLDEIRELVTAGNDPLAGQLRELADRKLPEIEALIERAERVRAWLQTAKGCGCHSIDECGLFDHPQLPPKDAARALSLVKVGGSSLARSG